MRRGTSVTFAALALAAAAVASVASVASGAAKPPTVNLVGIKPGTVARGTAAKWPTVIPIAGLQDLSGVVTAYGTPQQQGVNLAVDLINRSHLLGKSNLRLDVHDAGSNKQQAIIEAGKIAASDAVGVIGPINSPESASTSVILAQAGITNILTQSGTIEIGDNHIFRLTPPLGTVVARVVPYLKAKGSKRVALFVPTLSTTSQVVAKQQLPPMLKKAGIEIVAAEYVNNFTNSTFDAEVQKVVGARPDTVGILFGPGLSAIVNGLRAQGWKGTLFTVQGPSSFITAAGAAADGVVQPMTFSPLVKSSVVQGFVKAWQAKYGENTPVDYGAAESYDATLLLALGIREAKTPDRDGVRAGVAAVARRGFDGVQGRITFKGQQGRIAEPVLVRYGGGGTTVELVK